MLIAQFKREGYNLTVSHFQDEMTVELSHPTRELTNVERKTLTGLLFHAHVCDTMRPHRFGEYGVETLCANLGIPTNLVKGE